jgi:hypothetical protein
MADQEKPKQGDLTARVIGGVVGGTASVAAAAVLGPAGALIGGAVSPIVTDATRGLQSVLRRRIEKAEQAAAVATETSGHSIDDLIEAAADDDRKIEIIGRALQAAALAESEQTIKTLGKALAEGALAEDTALVDEYLRVVSALAGLEALDVRVLDRMSQVEHRWLIRPEEGRDIPAYSDADPTVEPVADAIFARLSTQGLITSVTAQWFGPSWSVTNFGHLCLTKLREFGSLDLDKA